MKKQHHIYSFLAGIFFTAIISWTGNNKQTNSEGANSDSNPVIAVRKIKLKEGVSADAFEKFAVRVAHDEFGKLPGVKFYYGKGERGDDPGSYLLFYEFDSKTTRNFYAPTEGAENGTQIKRTPEAEKMVNDYFSKYNPEFGKLAEVIKENGKKGYIDYIILK
jgi:hypothetical protein